MELSNSQTQRKLIPFHSFRPVSMVIQAKRAHKMHLFGANLDKKQ